MKMLLMVVATDLARQIADILIAKGFRVTAMPTKGAFFREGNTTLWSVMEAEEIHIAEHAIKSYMEKMELDLLTTKTEPSASKAYKINLFVLPVDKWVQY